MVLLGLNEMSRYDVDTEAGPERSRRRDSGVMQRSESAVNMKRSAWIRADPNGQ